MSKSKTWNKMLIRKIMPENFEEFVEKLQREIIEKEIEDHSEKIVNLCHNPQNWGKPSKDKITIFEERRGGPKGYFLGLYLNDSRLLS